MTIEADIAKMQETIRFMAYEEAKKSTKYQRIRTYIRKNVGKVINAYVPEGDNKTFFELAERYRKELNAYALKELGGSV